ncbi:alpha/beta hydrolase [Alkalihalophilus lindianensis]|uniref:Alpha/beta hydrolase n=1 Tax=Alkalihalophilus lindianensis TaxID=1630542 RepID=A0ABU3XDN2_9BACI|nr:alpha/beta hydrolase [Alkalihalophilus lindianensis]MDV2685742.1 alpha/beta hydrolase [Alkalihalophilus lindianensis]
MRPIEKALATIQQTEISFPCQEDALEEAMDTYTTFYGVKLTDIKHSYGYVMINQHRVFLQSFKPKRHQATILLVHGYFDHTGSMSHLINFLTTNGYHVWSYDLTGHGLSGGERISIDDFSYYQEVLVEVSEKYVMNEYHPTYLVAHSTGAAISLNILTQQPHTFNKVVMLAPLIRSYAWHASIVGKKMIPSFIKHTKRYYRKNTSNREYHSFVKQDPLQHHQVSLKWLNALFLWNQKVKVYSKSDQSVLVIQGDEDRTVDWRFNCAFIHQKLPESNIILVSGANHQLMNEHQQLRDQIFYLMKQYLEE